MTRASNTVIVPVKDLEKAKKLYGTLLGVAPIADSPYYVGYQLGEQHFGLDPNGHAQGLSGPIVFWDVDDIKQALVQLTGAGAVELQPVRDVGQGLMVATVKDADGNIIGLRQQPA